MSNRYNATIETLTAALSAATDPAAKADLQRRIDAVRNLQRGGFTTQGIGWR